MVCKSTPLKTQPTVIWLTKGWVTGDMAFGIVSNCTRESIGAYYLNSDHQAHATSPSRQKQDIKHNLDRAIPLIQGQNTDCQHNLGRPRECKVIRAERIPEPWANVRVISVP